ncbi:DUF1631 family protein [Pseudomonas psychrophila]|uniref:DUF1631 family protein n=1 Tax=Pseudomonas psychrophila TaxID=122355 RepID=UPI0003072F50|nr:DUF1631 family protein [Pseudomonas psychrophila]
MQNDGKVGSGHKAPTESAIHSPLTRLPVILLQVHDKAAQQLRGDLQLLFDNADETLFEMADKAQNNAEQSLFFEAMRDVRLKRKHIERGFLERLFYAFVKLSQPDSRERSLPLRIPLPNAFSLMNSGFERDQMINSMVAHVLSRDQLALCQLSTRLNTLSWVALDEHNNPLGPAMLCEYFLQAERDQGVDLKVKLIMLQLFEKYLLSQTSQLYADANQLLVATGVLPNLPNTISCCNLSTAARVQTSDVAGEDASRLVGQLFDYIGSDQTLAPALKLLIGQLQEPMLKIAQLDPNFFSSDSHPARCLLNVIADVAIGWDDSVDVHDDPVYQQIERVVRQLARCSCTNTPELLEDLLHDFLRFTHAERGRIEQLEHRTRAREQLHGNKARSLHAGQQSWVGEQDHLGLLLVSQLRIGTWIELQEDQACKLRCKLIAIFEPEGRYLFVNRGGMKVVEKSRSDLIGQLRSGTILLLDDRLLFDRALASVIGSMGQYSEH